MLTTKKNKDQLASECRKKTHTWTALNGRT